MSVHRARQFILSALLTCLLPLCSGPALALDPAFDVYQYAHTAWRYRDGFAKSSIVSLAQTPDGYLWLGTTAGLWRFDGARAMPWQPEPGQALPNTYIRALLAAKDGTLWIGTAKGLASIKGGRLVRIPEFEGGYVNSIIQDHTGTILASGQGVNGLALLCRMEIRQRRCFGADGSLGSVIGQVYEDDQGAVWIINERGIGRWKPGPPVFYPVSVFMAPQSFARAPGGGMVVITKSGLQKFHGDRFEPVPLPVTRDQPLNVFADRDGGIWVLTSGAGLLHLHHGRTDRYAASDGLSSNAPNRIFEDREGNIWVATQAGLDRFYTLSATTFSSAQGIVGPNPGAILADPDGGIWVSTLDSLNRSNGEMFAAYRPPGGNHLGDAQFGRDVIVPGLPKSGFGSLFRDKQGRTWFGSTSGLGYFENRRFTRIPGVPDGYIDSIVQDGEGTIWVAHRSGLYRVSRDLEVSRVRNTSLKWGFGTRLAADPMHGGLWVGLYSGGLYHLVNGVVVASYSPANGLGKSQVNEIRVAQDGAIWAATNAGLSRIKDNRIAILDSRGGLPCDPVDALVEGDDNAMWLYTACGLVRIPRIDIDVWTAAVDLHKAQPAVRVSVLADSDGVLSLSPGSSSATPQLTKALDGKLWFISVAGVTEVDPRHLATNPLPPPVHVEQVTADEKTYDPAPGLRLPALTRNVTIGYTGLSLVAPEKTHFRFKLEGQDKNWREVVNERSVQYSNLAPGHYRFRVTASNNSGVWNTEGASLSFAVAPAFWQTNWFLVLCVIAGLGLLASLYQWRAHRLVKAAARDREIERRQHESRMELAHANRLATLGQLTASIAHEVNQPLSGVLMNAQAALRWLKDPQPEVDEARVTLSRIVRDVTRASEIVKHVRAMSKKAPEHREDVDLNEAIAEVVAMTRNEASRRGVTLKAELDSRLPPVRGARVELQQVVLNLLMNALEALDAVKSEPKEVLIESRLNISGEVQVSVRDTGPGLDPEKLERIFQPFYTSKDTGLGMGLSICRTIIEAHDGKLWAAANPPRGAMFEFTLPTTTTRAEGPDSG
ncbi:MAG TPA: two-component regulator propeller domain-containing protein [Rhizomicrobium sp.]|nr:two-component regulator propeller domain-containing protein [Rhizomicrobium sp.]